LIPRQGSSRQGSARLYNSFSTSGIRSIRGRQDHSTLEFWTHGIINTGARLRAGCLTRGGVSFRAIQKWVAFFSAARLRFARSESRCNMFSELLAQPPPMGATSRGVESSNASSLRKFRRIRRFLDLHDVSWWAIRNARRRSWRLIAVLKAFTSGETRFVCTVFFMGLEYSRRAADRRRRDLPKTAKNAVYDRAAVSRLAGPYYSRGATQFTLMVAAARACASSSRCEQENGAIAPPLKTRPTNE
jgi:hypothetical protein